MCLEAPSSPLIQMFCAHKPEPCPEASGCPPKAVPARMIEFPAVPRVLQVPGSSSCCCPRVCGSSTFDPGVNAGGSAAPAVPGSPCARGVLYSRKTLGLDWNVGTGAGLGASLAFPACLLKGVFSPLWPPDSQGLLEVNRCLLEWTPRPACAPIIQHFLRSEHNHGGDSPPYPAGWCHFNNK